jgi:hypothetical protein
MDAEIPEILTDPPDLWELSPTVQDIAMAYYRAGTRAGFEDGYAQAEEDLAALQRQAVAAARSAAAGTRYSDLAAKRGDHERAARARAREDAIMAAPSPSTPGWTPDAGPPQGLERIRNLPGIGQPVDLSRRDHPQPTPHRPARATTASVRRPL